jgi:hypothetical protein
MHGAHQITRQLSCTTCAHSLQLVISMHDCCQLEVAVQLSSSAHSVALARRVSGTQQDIRPHEGVSMVHVPWTLVGICTSSYSVDRQVQ